MKSPSKVNGYAPEYVIRSLKYFCYKEESKVLYYLMKISTIYGGH